VKCQLCDNPATIHLTDIVQNKKREIHLCRPCAEAQKLVKAQDLNLPAILQAFLGQHVGQQMEELARLACPDCGIRYMEFRAQGRLGCPRDYEVFEAGIVPLVQRIHRSQRHVGKVPRCYRPDPRQVELNELRRQLQGAVAEERYEEAARLRDLLREREGRDES
jgi:protein arginine kinase activator